MVKVGLSSAQPPSRPVPRLDALRLMLLLSKSRHALGNREGAPDATEIVAGHAGCNFPAPQHRPQKGWSGPTKLQPWFSDFNFTINKQPVRTLARPVRPHSSQRLMGAVLAPVGVLSLGSSFSIKSTSFGVLAESIWSRALVLVLVLILSSTARPIICHLLSKTQCQPSLHVEGMIVGSDPDMS